MRSAGQPDKPTLALGRPQDKSLQAFKDLVNHMFVHLGGDPDNDDMAEEEWARDWQEFWADEEPDTGQLQQ